MTQPPVEAFAFALAERLGMTVGELGVRMDGAELMAWARRAARQTTWEDRIELMLANFMAMYAAANGAKRARVTDFLVDREPAVAKAPEPMTEGRAKMLEARATLWMRAHNANVAKRSRVHGPGG